MASRARVSTPEMRNVRSPQDAETPNTGLGLTRPSRRGYRPRWNRENTPCLASHNAAGPSVTTIKLEPYKLLDQDQSPFSSGGGDRLLGCRFKNRSLEGDTRAKHTAHATSSLIHVAKKQVLTLKLKWTIKSILTIK
jgi:hypothetical protein